MNFEFPLTELPAVMRGPRVERRRVLVGGSAYWGTVVEDGPEQGLLRLDDTRVVDPATVQHLPPVAPSKIIARNAGIKRILAKPVAGYTLKTTLADELAQLSGSDRFAFIAQHRGMFSRLGASPEVVQKIKDEFAIYMVGDSRLNIAGLNDTTVPILARAIIEAGI